MDKEPIHLEFPDVREVTAAVLTVGPGDVVVIMHPGRLGHVGADRIREFLADKLPAGVPVLVLEDGATFGVLRSERPARPDDAEPIAPGL